MSHFRTLALRRTLRASTLDRLQLWLCDAILSSPDLRRDTTIAFRETDLAILPTDGQRLTLAISLQFCAVIYGVRSKRHPRATADLLELKSHHSSDVAPDAQAGDRHDPGDLEDADNPDDSDEYFDVQLAFDRETLRTFLVEVETENLTGYRLPDSLRAHATTLLQSDADLHPWFERAVLDLITAWEAERTLGETLESFHQPSDRQESERETDAVTSDSSVLSQKPDRDQISPNTENTESETIEDEQSDIILVDILRDTISRARCFLQLDRLAIYQFAHSAEALKPAVRNAGSIVYEALVAPEMGSLQISTLLVRDFLPEGVQLDILDDPIAIDRVTSLSRSSRERQALESAQVQSQVIVPLRLRDRLWGVLFAQQCTQPRTWSQYDLDFLRYVAADMSLAIQQAHAVAELQQQKYMIEQAAEQQAHQLHDALQTTQAAKQTRTEFCR
ncbi:MAG: GAF domain-containing protein [Coleofasciculaceae cyanobacterium RL_1_1]|nr:GAF domain-containing protein [Coleofasciculaceae cyanobacterium RL_1_1]